MEEEDEYRQCKDEKDEYKQYMDELDEYIEISNCEFYAKKTMTIIYRIQHFLR